MTLYKMYSSLAVSHYIKELERFFPSAVCLVIFRATKLAPIPLDLNTPAVRQKTGVCK